MGDDDPDIIKVCEPRLPEAEALAPYLRTIDLSRHYSNFGPLLRRFEGRLATHFGVTDDCVVGVANGTTALTLALRALDAPAGTLCLVPAWTFVATAHAATAAGLVPYFVDIDPESWAMEPAIAAEALRRAPGPVGAALPVSPYGAPLDWSGWESFAAETGVRVAVDAASGFDTARPGRIPISVSLHATKPFGIGEGGVLVSRDRALIARVRRLSNFGFERGREADVPAVNAKLSEFAGAIGLAAFDAWPYTRAGYASLARSYAAALSAVPGVRPAPGFGAGWAPSTCVVALQRAAVRDVVAHLTHERIQTLRWWGDGCHRQPAFADCPCAPLEVTDDLAPRTLGLPFHLALGPRQLNAVIGGLADSLVATSTREPPSVATKARASR
jgi:dTDP-4-amino-4,6-dideoxygalactose transaminase